MEGEREPWRVFENEAAAAAERWAADLRAGHDIHEFSFTTDKAQAEAQVAMLDDEWLPSVYVIGLPTGTGAIAAERFRATCFEVGERRRRANLPALPRIPKRPSRSDCLYVGKVRGPWDTDNKLTVKKRLQQHLVWGDEPTCRGTSACRLQMWLPDECWPVRVRGAMLAPVHGENRVLSRLVEFLEDRLWEENQPVLGQRGGR